MTTRLERLLRPGTIAVFGGRKAQEVVAQCDRMGFAGEIWPVNPNREEIAGRPCFRSVEELPGAPDAAFVGVNRHATLKILRALRLMGTGGAVSYASGFGETGEDGAALQALFVEAAGDMPVLGPNCYGVINYLDGALLWPDVHGGKRVGRGVAFVTQSSNIALNLTMSRRGLPIAYVVTLGNQAVIGLPEAVESLAADERVTAIGLHIEGIADPAGFAGAALAAHEAGKPIVAIKGGRSETGARLAMSHTASLAGADAVMDALFDRLGIARVHGIPVLLEALKILHAGGPLAGDEIASLSCSGGEALLMADAVVGRRVGFRAFTPAETARIEKTVNPLVTVSNPFDYHTFDWGRQEKLTETFEAVMRAGQAFALLVLDWPAPALGPAPVYQTAADALAEAAARTGGRAGVLATLPETMTDERAEALMACGLVPLFGIEDAVSALEAAALVGQARPRPYAPAVATADRSAVALSESEAKARLAASGLAVPRGRLCRTEDEAVKAAGEIGWPVVAKASGRDIPHKTEMNALALGLPDEEALREAFRRLAPLGDGVLVEERVTAPVVELIVGVARDPLIGLHLVVGAGGVATELWRDSRIVLLPAEADDIRTALMSLKSAPLLTGFRGRPAADIEAAVGAVLAVARLALERADTLEELDVNPLFVLAEGEGAVAVDALMRVRED